ncbi:unnamed protein product [Moneuplotes crassus]|uniref:Uncharacterized protein n=2 Tax=Euplotes crassus TaxID=5936 RepID=A0AAD2D6Z9_EUPCR|nr:unnamed protein product [Moneuplotes crassus]
MEQLYSLHKKLDPAIDTAKAKGLNTHLEGMKMLESLQYENEDLMRFLPVLSQSCFHSGAHRTIKLHAYILIRNFCNSEGFIWDEVLGTILTDFDTMDKELQKNAFMTLAHFPKFAACEFLTSMETILLKYLEIREGKKGAPPMSEDEKMLDYQNKHHCLEYLPKFLIKTFAMVEGDEESFATKDIIKDLFRKILDFIFHSDNFLASKALEALKDLLEAFYLPEYCNFPLMKETRKKSDGIKCDDSYSLNKWLREEFENSTYFMPLQPLVNQMLNYIFPDFPVLMYRISCLDRTSSANLYDVPVLLFKYLLELSEKERKQIEFKDIEDSIDDSLLIFELLDELSEKILNLHVKSEDLIYPLFSNFVKLLSLSDTHTCKPSRIQLESSNLLYTVSKHLVGICKGQVLSFDCKIKSVNPDPYIKFNNLIFDGIHLKLCYILPLITDPAAKSEIAMDLLPLCKYLTSVIDRFSALKQLFKFLIGKSLEKCLQNSENFSFKNERWFLYTTQVINILIAKEENFIWEEELFLCCIQSLLQLKSQIPKITKKVSKGSVFDGADQKFLIEAWLKLIFDFSEQCLRLLEIQNAENCDKNSLCIGFLKFLEDIAKMMNSIGDTAMTSYFKYKFDNFKDAVINRTPIVGLVEQNTPKEERKEDDPINEEIIPDKVREDIKDDYSVNRIFEELWVAEILSSHIKLQFEEEEPGTDDRINAYFNFLNAYKVKPHPITKKPKKLLKEILDQVELSQEYKKSLKTFKESQTGDHKLSREPFQTLVTGLADLLQIYISYEVKRGSMITFHIDIVNVTNICITNCLLSFALSDNLEMVSSDSVSLFSMISPEQRLKKTVTAKIKKFEQCACTVIATFQECDINPIKSVPFRVKLKPWQDQFKI